MPHLSVRHRDSPEHGCPSAALLDEIARCADATRRAYTDKVLTAIDDAARVVPHDPRPAREQAFSIYALMARTLQLSRALMDQQPADAVLEQGIQSALTLLGAEDLRQSADRSRGVRVSPGAGAWRWAPPPPRAGARSVMASHTGANRDVDRSVRAVKSRSVGYAASAAHPTEAGVGDMAQLLAGFAPIEVDIDAIWITGRTAGTGPPGLLLHGCPQTQ
ncbi:hypothetical protein ACFY6U_05515 [Streptomyces sp. NPDC013157]|uniref:hypothetical protein n=1 Tax=Streptomyces sp. NPDC013157 TaxID=3364861 RepID=UPI0036A261F5